MKIILKNALLFGLGLILAAPAIADSTLHIWSCNLQEGKTRADLMSVTKTWSDAAKTIDGGANLEVSLEFPYAANVPDGAFNFVLSIPDTRLWGVWEANYAGSAAAKVDEAWSEVATCSNSSLWNSVVIN